MQRLRTYFYNPYNVLFVIFTYFIVFAFIVDTPQNILEGLIIIVVSPDLLITDYIYIGGIGATLVNAAIINLLFLYYMVRIHEKPSGALIMAFWLFAGFAFFGKNIVNVWPIILGGWLYAKFKGEHFDKYAVVTMLGTALAPTVTQIALIEQLPIQLGIVLALIYGTFLGFVLPPIAQNMMSIHQGFNLYNVGFATGILSILSRIFIYVTIAEDNIYPVSYWSSDEWLATTIFMAIIFMFLIFVGILCGENHKENFIELNKRSGQAPSDFFADYGSIIYINMGLLGLFCIVLIFLINGDINGPVAGCILTVVGFGAYGKHLRNCWSLMLGCLIAGGFIQIFYGTIPSASLAVLLVTSLAPIPGYYGWKWGIIAGALHLHIAANVVAFSGGLNLYNNGLAAGFVAMFLLPIIKSLKEHKKDLPVKN
ncbi:MAG: DUF1576 domain-containing protein [Turicibacter sp.]|nr:DUF1576 domain-containing protein [Turicibacter sp.]